MEIGLGETFDVMPERIVHDTVTCNLMSMTRMTRLILPGMIQRRRGVIVNIGSLSSAGPTPLLALYGATKAFVDKFSQDLAAEVRDQGVVVSTVHPGYVFSQMSLLDLPSVVCPDPDTYVTATLKTLGLESRTAGFWFHKIQVRPKSSFPFVILLLIVF